MDAGSSRQFRVAECAPGMYDGSMAGWTLGGGFALDNHFQKMRLIVNGAVCLYEGQGLEIAQVLRAQGREDLVAVMDALTTAMYWIQVELEIGDGDK